MRFEVNWCRASRTIRQSLSLNLLSGRFPVEVKPAFLCITVYIELGDSELDESELDESRGTKPANVFYKLHESITPAVMDLFVPRLLFPASAHVYYR
jgi:hypothetical protein